MDIRPGNEPFGPQEAREYVAELRAAFDGEPGADLVDLVAPALDSLDNPAGLAQARKLVADLLDEHATHPSLGVLGLVAGVIGNVDPHRVEHRRDGRLADVVELRSRTG